MQKTILLVEDNLHDLELTLIALERCNLPYAVEVARDGEEALHYLLRQGKYAHRGSGNPSLILLDLKMPKIDGVELLKFVRSTPSLVDIPVVILSAYNLEADLRRAQSLSIADYIVKPIQWQGFSGILCKTLSMV
jgi:CheY-like chemotaxis protein